MSQGTADYSVYLRHALSGNVAIAEKQRTAEEMQNARWIVMRRHKERRRNTGAEWKGRSIFFWKKGLKELYGEFLINVLRLHRCGAMVPVIHWIPQGDWSLKHLNTATRTYVPTFSSSVIYYCVFINSHVTDKCNVSQFVPRGEWTHYCPAHYGLQN